MKRINKFLVVGMMAFFLATSSPQSFAFGSIAKILSKFVDNVMEKIRPSKIDPPENPNPPDNIDSFAGQGTHAVSPAISRQIDCLIQKRKSKNNLDLNNVDPPGVKIVQEDSNLNSSTKRCAYDSEDAPDTSKELLETIEASDN